MDVIAEIHKTLGLKCTNCKVLGARLIPLGMDYYCPECFREEEGKLSSKDIKTKAAWNEVVTPTSFSNYIGQQPIKIELKIMLEATKKHKIPVQHCLFSGSFGLGKTTLAKIFASKIGSKHGLVTASGLKSEKDMPKEPVVVIDEIHTIPTEEWLLTLMDKGVQTILASTTSAGSLSGPLRSRFVSLVLKSYTTPELQTMVSNAAKKLGYNCPKFVSLEVAKRGKGVARIALFLFKRIYDRIVINNGNVSAEQLSWWFREIGIDSEGLDDNDRAYLSGLSDHPVGLQHLTAVTGLDKETVTESVEPFLLNKGYVIRTPRGRVKGREPLNNWTVESK